MAQIILELSDSYTQKLETKAKNQQKTIEEILAHMIQMFINIEEIEDKTEPFSCLELAKDLAGCVEAEKDLSTNKNYLNGFGS